MPLDSTVSFLSYYRVCERPIHLGVSSQMSWDLMAFNKPITFNIPICLSNGNVEGNDKLCGWYASHSTKFLNSECNILMEDADDLHAICQRTSASTITNHVASNNMKELQCQGYHVIDNATNGLDFGANKHGWNQWLHPGRDPSPTTEGLDYSYP